MTPGTSPAMPSGHLATSEVTTADYDGDSKADLIVEVSNTNVSDSAGTIASLDLFTGNGSGGFSFTSTYLTGGHPNSAVTGLVVGDFSGPSGGLEAAVALRGDQPDLPASPFAPEYIKIVPLSSAGTWGNGVLYPLNNTTYSGQGGNMVARRSPNGA